MSPKAIAITIGLIVLVYTAGKPFGALVTDMGNVLTVIGNHIQSIGHG